MFKSRDYVTIYLKSGKTVEVECEKANLYTDTSTGKLTRYAFTGRTKPTSLYIDVDSIESIVVNTKQVLCN